MKKILLISLFFIPIISFASSDLRGKIDTCKSVIDSTQRLRCYDSTFDVKQNTIKVDNKGKWVVSEKISPIDDSKSVFLTLLADSNISTKFGRKETPHLVIRCKENKTELYIGFETFLGSDTTYPTTRVDSEKAISNISWDISTNYKGIFYSQKTISYIKNLLNKNKLFIQITPYGENPVNTTFTLTGLNEAIKPLSAACGW